MKYTNIPYVEKPVSRIVLGGSSDIFRSGGDVGEVMAAALSCGINVVDTAREYRKSEEAIGRWLREGGKREDIVIISKCCHPVMSFVPRVGERQAEDDLKRSLSNLGTDRIDIYLLHRDNEAVPVGRIIDFLNRFHEEGRIGAFGGSNWRAERVAEANAYAESHGLVGFTVSSPHYSLGRQKRDPWGNGCRTITGEKNAAQREFYIKTGMPVIAWSSLCAGVFSGKLKSSEKGKIMKYFGFNPAWAYDCSDNYERLRRCEELAERKGATVAQLALAWLLGDEMTVLPVVAASSPKRVMENARAAELELTAEERQYLAVK